MKNPPFNYHRPAALPEALALLAEYGDDAKILAGGQSLLPVMALRLGRPDHVIDIGSIDELQHITTDDTGVTLGAMVRHAEAEKSVEVAERAPMVAAAMPHVGHRAIRNRGTVVGSIAHADAAAEMPAVCLATGATMHIASATGTRTVAAADFFQGHFTTAVDGHELLTSVHFPTPTATSGSTIVEISRRHGDYAMCGLACSVDASNGTITNAALAFFSVASTAVRVTEAEASLVGKPLGDAAFADAAAIVSSTLTPRRRHPRDRRLPAPHRRCPDPQGPRRGRRPNRSPRMSLPSATTPIGETLAISVTVNGTHHELHIEPRRSLADVIREDIGLTGTHLGCEHGVCGAVHSSARRRTGTSVSHARVQADHAAITTIEGLADADGTLHPVQQAMYDAMSFPVRVLLPGLPDEHGRVAPRQSEPDRG